MEHKIRMEFTGARLLVCGAIAKQRMTDTLTTVVENGPAVERDSMKA